MENKTDRSFVDMASVGFSFVVEVSRKSAQPSRLTRIYESASTFILLFRCGGAGNRTRVLRY